MHFSIFFIVVGLTQPFPFSKLSKANSARRYRALRQLVAVNQAAKQLSTEPRPKVFLFIKSHSFSFFAATFGGCRLDAPLRQGSHLILLK